MSVRKEADLPSPKPRSDEELQTALAVNSRKLAPILKILIRVQGLRDARYQKYVGPYDEELQAIKESIWDIQRSNVKIEAELKANSQVRAAEERARAAAEANRLKEERKRIFEEERRGYVVALGQRLMSDANSLRTSEDPLLQGLSAVLGRTIEHPDFGNIANRRIRVGSPPHSSARIILGEESEYFLCFNRGDQSPVGQAVRDITTEAQKYVPQGRPEVIGDFFGIKVDANAIIPSMDPFVLTFSNDRMFLPEHVDNPRFSLPLEAMAGILKSGSVQFKKVFPA